MDLKEYQTATTLRAEIGFWQHHQVQIQKLLERKAESKLRTAKKGKPAHEFEDDDVEDPEVSYTAKEESLFTPPKAELKLVSDGLPIYTFLFRLGEFSIDIYLKLVESKIMELDKLFKEL